MISREKSLNGNSDYMKFLAGILFFSILLPDCIKAQTRRVRFYTIRISEQVNADYTNLLDTGTIRHYRHFDKFYVWTAAVTRLADTAVFLQLKADSIRENGIFSSLNAGSLHFVYKTDSSQPFGRALYTDTVHTLPVLNHVKSIVSNIPFLLKDNKPGLEPYVDGIYQSVYTLTQGRENEIVLHKDKQVIYPPGVQLFRNCIDSFNASFIYSNELGMLSQGFFYENKRQKMGKRVLSVVKIQGEVTTISNAGLLLLDTTDYSAMCILPIPIYTRTGYVERVKNQSARYSSVSSVKTLMQKKKEINTETAGLFISTIRSSLLNGKVSFEEIKLVLDTMDTALTWFRILEDALVECGTVEAQDLLAELLERKGEPDFFYKRLLVKIGVTAPVISRKLVDKIIGIKKDNSHPNLSSVAGLSLANNAFLMINEEMPLRRNGILQTLRNHFQLQATHRNNTIQWLQEAGNAADDSVAALVTSCLKGQDKDLRAEALYALRFIPGSLADSLIADYLPVVMKEKPAVLNDMLKLRYPSSTIRQAIYKYVNAYKGPTTTGINALIDYLKEWQDEIKTLSAELIQRGL